MPTCCAHLIASEHEDGAAELGRPCPGGGGGFRIPFAERSVADDLRHNANCASKPSTRSARPRFLASEVFSAARTWMSCCAVLLLRSCKSVFVALAGSRDSEEEAGDPDSAALGGGGASKDVIPPLPHSEHLRHLHHSQWLCVLQKGAHALYAKSPGLVDVHAWGVLAS